MILRVEKSPAGRSVINTQTHSLMHQLSIHKFCFFLWQFAGGGTATLSLASSKVFQHTIFRTQVVETQTLQHVLSLITVKIRCHVHPNGQNCFDVNDFTLMRFAFLSVFIAHPRRVCWVVGPLPHCHPSAIFSDWSAILQTCAPSRLQCAHDDHRLSECIKITMSKCRSSSRLEKNHENPTRHYPNDVKSSH